MNVLLVCSKQDSKEYETVLKSVPNTTLLGTVLDINKNFIDDIQDRWTPHTIIFVNGVKYSDNCDLHQTIKDIRYKYPYIKVVYIHGSDEKNTEMIEKLADLQIFSVITRIITNVELAEVLKHPFNSKQEADEFNSKQAISEEKEISSKQKLKVNPLIFASTSVCVLAVILLVVIILPKNGNTATIVSADETSTVNEITTEHQKSTEETTVLELETETESESSPTVATSPSYAPTEAITEKHTETPTEKPKTKSSNSSSSKSSSSKSNSGASSSNSNRSSNSNNNSSSNKSNSSSSSFNNRPSPMPPAPSSSTITDDGNIYFDKDSYTIKAGERFEIKVSGLAASRGCNWNLENNSIVKFVSADTTKVVLKALSPGSTIVTATSKTNSASRQVLITVV